MEFRRNGAAVSRMPNQPHQPQVSQFRLQQPLPQQFASQQLLQQPRRSNSLSPLYMLPPQRQLSSAGSTPISAQQGIQQNQSSSFPISALGTATPHNLSTTSSISSASTNNSDFSQNLSSSRVGGLSQSSSTFDDLMSPKFNPFGANGSGNNAGPGAAFLLSTSSGNEFSLNTPSALSSSNGMSSFKQGNASSGASNIWGTDMSVWG